MKQALLQLPRQAIVYGLGQVLARGAGFLLIPLYTHSLSQEEYGILAVTASLSWVLAIILGLGIDAAVVRFFFDHQGIARREYCGTAWIAMTITSLIATALLDKFGAPAAHALFPAIPFTPYLRLILWANFFALSSAIPLALFRARQQATRYALLTAGGVVMTLALTLAFVVGLRRGARGALEASLVSAAVFAVPYWVIALRNVRLVLRLSFLREVLAFGLPLVPHALAAWALNLSDRIILQRTVSLEQTSIYYLGYQVGAALGILGMAINNAWSPFVYRIVSEEDAHAPQIIARLSTYGLAVIVLVGLAVALFASEAVRLLAPAGYWKAAPVAEIVALAFVLQGFYFFIVSGLFASKRTAPLPLVTAAAAASNIALNVWLIPRFGILAPAWNTAVGFAVLLGGSWLLSRRLYPVPFEWKRIGCLLGVSACAALAGLLIRLPAPYSPLAKIALFAAVPLTLFRLGFFPPRDRMLLRECTLALLPAPLRGASR
jgi:O-antigen/teichoic acid export membrane protein